MLTLFISFILAVGVMLYYAEQDRIQEEVARQTREAIEKARSDLAELSDSTPTQQSKSVMPVAVKIGKIGETQLTVEAEEKSEKTAISTSIASHSSRALSRQQLKRGASSDVAAYFYKKIDKFRQKLQK